MIKLPPNLNTKPVLIRLGVGAVLGLVGGLTHHVALALWTALVLAFGFGTSTYMSGENKNACLVDIAMVAVGAPLGLLVHHLL